MEQGRRKRGFERVSDTSVYDLLTRIKEFAGFRCKVAVEPLSQVLERRPQKVFELLESAEKLDDFGH